MDCMVYDLRRVDTRHHDLGVGLHTVCMKGETEMMAVNTIYSDEEYIKQGFRPDEVEDVRRSDILFNKRQEWTPEEQEEYRRLVAKLVL